MNDPRYTERMTMADEGDGSDGEWLLCSVCDGAWRLDAPCKHEDSCPIPELQMLIAHGGRVGSDARWAQRWLAAERRYGDLVSAAIVAGDHRAYSAADRRRRRCAQKNDEAMARLTKETQ